MSKGEKLGEVRVYERQRLIASSPLVASRSMSEPGTIHRVRWFAGRAAHNAWGWVS